MQKKKKLAIGMAVGMLLCFALGYVVVTCSERCNRPDLPDEEWTVPEEEVATQPNDSVVYDDIWSCLNEMVVPSVLVGNCRSEQYAVFLETRSSESIKGHYMSLADNHADTIAFELSKAGRKIRFVSDDDDVKLRVNKPVIDTLGVSGTFVESWFGKESYAFSYFHAPDYVEYDTKRYEEPIFEVEKSDSVLYAHVRGFWPGLDDDASMNELIGNLGETLKEEDFDLYLDVYAPKDDTLARRPLIMLIHGGAFYYGTRNDLTVSKLCANLASMGYVTASIDYRLGFTLTKDGIERAGYRAIQDAHAAMRYLVAHQQVYGIDTSRLFVGGCSAGGIASLGLGFMTDETRPNASRKNLFRDDLGGIASSGNDLDVQFSLKGIVGMWGALPDIDMLEGKNIPILAFHGDCDNIVPYDFDYPFSKIGRANRLLFDKMYGSSCIVERLKELGRQAELITFEGCEHSPQYTDNELNDKYYFIADKIEDFIAGLVTPKWPDIISDDDRYCLDMPVVNACWKVDGGLIVACDDNAVRVVWIDNAPQRVLRVSGVMPTGVGFVRELNTDACDSILPAA